jgi:hypothetical protein
MGWYNGCVHLLILLFTTFKPAAAGFYDCTDGVECSATYGPPTVGTQADVEAACDADTSCVAFQYNAGQVRLS